MITYPQGLVPKGGAFAPSCSVAKDREAPESTLTERGAEPLKLIISER